MHQQAYQHCSYLSYFHHRSSQILYFNHHYTGFVDSKLSFVHYVCKALLKFNEDMKLDNICM